MKWAILNITSSTASSEALIGDIPVTLRVSARARRLRLRVDPRTRAVLLTMPRRASRKAALAWAGEHRAWLEATLAAMPEPAAIIPGSTIPWRGGTLRVDWARTNPRRVRIDGDRLIVHGGNSGPDGLYVQPRGETWILDLSTNIWSVITKSVPTPAREYHNGVWDRANQRLILFGGAGEDPFTSPFFNDTWSLDVATETWTKLQPAGTAPTARIRPMAAMRPTGSAELIRNRN